MSGARQWSHWRAFAAPRAGGVEPAPERNRKRTWGHFLKRHWETLYACDFFSVEVLGVLGTVRCMVFFVMCIKTRAVQIAGSASLRTAIG